MNKKILIISASIDGGHNSVANSVRELIERESLAEVQIFDFFSDNSKLLHHSLLESYLLLLRLLPKSYGFFYELSDTQERELAERVLKYQSKPREMLQDFSLEIRRAKVGKETLSEVGALLLLMVFWQFYRKIKKEQPDLIICTYPLPLALLNFLKEKGELNIPVVGIVTDYTVHRQWLFPRVEHYILGHPDLRYELYIKKINLQSIHYTGIPLPERFGKRRDVTEARRALEIPETALHLVMMGGSLGLGKLKTYLKSIQSLLEKDSIYVSVVCGNNTELYDSLNAYKPHQNLRVLGYVDDMPSYLSSASLLITKPGGISTTEALAMRVPLGLLAPLLGQEERNYEFLVNHGVALSLRDPDHVLSQLEMFIHNRKTQDRIKGAIADFYPEETRENLFELLNSLLYK